MSQSTNISSSLIEIAVTTGKMVATEGAIGSLITGVSALVSRIISVKDAMILGGVTCGMVIPALHLTEAVIEDFPVTKKVAKLALSLYIGNKAISITGASLNHATFLTLIPSAAAHYLTHLRKRC